jgi:hypothetical protein
MALRCVSKREAAQTRKSAVADLRTWVPISGRHEIGWPPSSFETRVRKCDFAELVQPRAPQDEGGADENTIGGSEEPRPFGRMRG